MPPTAYSLLLEVYLPGGVEVDWSVSSDADHLRPYLLAPQKYEGQEIDPVSAAATIGTVEVGVIDPAQIPGEQSTGWMTEHLGTLRGRRCVLRRYIDALLGYVIIADGPAGTPRLDASYSAYRWPIRDTREVERKLKAFHAGASTALLPRGPIAGFGALPDDGWLLAPVEPLVGVYSVDAWLGIRAGWVDFPDLWAGVPGGAGGTVEVDPSLVIDEEGEAALAGQADGLRTTFPNADILWRLAGSADPWNVARPMLPPPYHLANAPFAYIGDGMVDGEEVRALTRLMLWGHEIGGVYIGTEPFGASDTEGVGEELEIIIRHRGPASEAYPHYYEGTVGALLADLYDGALSGAEPIAEAARVRGDLYDPAELQVVAVMLAGGVRYDAPAMAAITTPVLLRQTEPVPDGRNWAEQTIYGPSGWIPALDNDGAISPVSRARPTAVSGPLIDDAIAEPSPDWNAGERIVTSVEVSYHRYFKPTFPLLVETEPDGLAIKPVSVTYLDAEAQAQEGEQTESYDGAAFSAAGDAAGNALAGDIEAGAFVAQQLRYEVLSRYRAGAQAIRVRVRRTDAPALRIGEWCPVALSWLPNTMSGLRGLELAAVQVLSINDSEGAWRHLLLEEGAVFALPGFFSDGEVIADEASAGYFDALEVLSDEEGGS